jgi:hypothetical protein
MGRKAPRKRLTRRVMACPTGVSQTPERLSALRFPLNSGERSKGEKTRVQKTRRGNEGVLSKMSAPKKKPTRAEQERAAAEQRRLAPVLREAHARLRLWRLCEHQTCRRSKSCGCGDADQCGARVAEQGWAWLHHVIKAMREGKAQEDAVEAANCAVVGIRDRATIRWKVKGWDPIKLVQLADGTWRRADMVPSRPDIDPQFFELAASPWLRSAVLRAHVEEVS